MHSNLKQINRTVVDRLQGIGARAVCALPESWIKLLAGPPVIRDGQRLDPLIQLMLRWFADKPGNISPPEKLRHTFDLQGSWLAHPLSRTVGISPYSFRGPNGPIDCEIHRGPDSRANADCIVFYHGGGHSAGSLISHRNLCNRLALDTGCVVIAVDYRLAPEHRFPIGIQDCLAAFDHVHTHARALSIDPTRIAVAGDSAGGNAAAVVAQQRRDPEGARPYLQILWVPWLCMTTDTHSYQLFELGFMLEKPTMKWYIDNYLRTPADAKDPLAAPLLGNVKGVCPALLFVAGFDPLRDEGLAYAEKLKSAGVSVECRLFSELVHPFANTAHAIPAARRAWNEATQSILRAFGRQFEQDV
ncbi:alpha/beta hydrolase [Pseudomonas oryzihabitans]|uniref:alpha/beta hydrolase n=1 Tax=Pseudomonas oryzihabitans TaxID=47885 RepID=UPI0011A71E98|nr:alpha/beta hydrolase fold domain-containing protein [Pseudomonas oryzihabitans]